MTPPSAPAIVATVLASCVLGVAGFVVGKGSGPAKIPAAVPVQAVRQPATAPIVVPPEVALPRR